VIGLPLGYVVVFVLLVGIASFVESPVGRGFDAFQLNVLIRGGSLVAAVAALLATHGLALPPARAVLAGLGIGVITGMGSIFYCVALDYLTVAMVVTFSNLYIVITTLLGIVALGEPMTALKVAGLACTVTGIVWLGRAPARYGVDREAGARNTAAPAHAFVVMAAYVVVVGVGAFLEKPALRQLDATQLNGLMAIAMTAIACVAIGVKGPRVPMTRRALAGFAVGAMIGVASVFYFLGLEGMPVSVAAAASNASIVVTVILSSIFLHQPLTAVQRAAIALTLLGVTQLALSTG
jgi:drug/metabolite transporter (DMT)-like permease